MSEHRSRVVYFFLSVDLLVESNYQSGLLSAELDSIFLDLGAERRKGPVLCFFYNCFFPATGLTIPHHLELPY